LHLRSSLPPTLSSALSSSSPIHKQASRAIYHQAGLHIIITTTTTTTTSISKVIDRVLEKHKQHLPLEVLIISL
jgi:hypothetical protein